MEENKKTASEFGRLWGWPNSEDEKAYVEQIKQDFEDVRTGSVVAYSQLIRYPEQGYPSLGTLLDIEDLKDEWERVKLTPAERSNFINKQLNVFTQQYLGDVTGYQAQVAELKDTVSQQNATIQGKEQTIQEHQQTIQGQTEQLMGLAVAVEAVAAISTELPNELALDIAEVFPGCFPTWEDVLEKGWELAAGRVIVKDGTLYRVIQVATPQAHQIPGGEGMLAIYRPIELAHAGMLDDPIPWVYGMDCATGLYYSHEGSVYLCKGLCLGPGQCGPVAVGKGRGDRLIWRRWIGSRRGSRRLLVL